MVTGIILIFSVLLVDQLTKLIVMNTIAKSGNTVIIIKNLLEFEFVLNENISFGIPVPKVVIFLITFIAFGIFVYLFKSVNFKKLRVYSIGISFMIAGALGNFIDRIFRKGVVDFIYHPFLGDIHSVLNFIYNIADIILIIGVILFIVDMFFLEPKRKKLENENN